VNFLGIEFAVTCGMVFVSNDPRNSPPCPKCLEGRGMPTSVEAFKGRTTIGFRCGVCGFEWHDVRGPAEIPPGAE
jgi:hypothetical protein